jgi:hypothetical protein
LDETNRDPIQQPKKSCGVGSNCYMPMYLISLLPIETPQTILEKAKDQPSQTHECGQHLKPKVFKIAFKLIMRDTHHPVTKFWPPLVYTCKLQIWKLKISHTSIIKLYNYFLLSFKFRKNFSHCPNLGTSILQPLNLLNFVEVKRFFFLSLHNIVGFLIQAINHEICWW